MVTQVMAHDYVSASKIIEQALELFSSTPQNDDSAFHNLVITLVDEAINGTKLHMPIRRTFSNNGSSKPFCFEKQGVKVYALYTDQRMAEACTTMCVRAANDDAVSDFWATVEIPLEDVIQMQTVGLALNMGMPNQVLLPPDVVHTVAHLCFVRKLGARCEQEGSAWNEWIDIMNRYFDKQNKDSNNPVNKLKELFNRKFKKHIGDTELRFPIKNIEVPPFGICLGDKPEPKYELL